jgi:hypothetical protein
MYLSKKDKIFKKMYVKTTKKLLFLSNVCVRIYKAVQLTERANTLKRLF